MTAKFLCIIARCRARLRMMSRRLIFSVPVVLLMILLNECLINMPRLIKTYVVFQVRLIVTCLTFTLTLDDAYDYFSGGILWTTTNQYCIHDIHRSYNSLPEAKAACFKAGATCIGIYDNGCSDPNEVVPYYSLCKEPRFSTSSGDCLYASLNQTLGLM